jgi:ABC-2 type transport system permease protein
MTATVTTRRVSATTGPYDPSHLRVFRAATRAEWTKMRSVRSTIWTLLVAVVLAVGFSALVAASHINTWDTLDPIEQAGFDPTFFSLSGLLFAQLAIGVLGVLMATSEYATGQIRATLAATPQRLTVLAAKATTFVGVVLVVGLVLSFSAFGVGQAIFSSKGIDASLNDPGVLRAVIGGALYLATVGVLGLGLGTIIRRTAGAIAGFVGLILVLSVVSNFLPASWNRHVTKYFPARAGAAVFSVVPDPTSLSPWTGLAVLLAYATVALVAGGVLLRRHDA